MIRTILLFNNVFLHFCPPWFAVVWSLSPDEGKLTRRKEFKRTRELKSEFRDTVQRDMDMSQCWGIVPFSFLFSSFSTLSFIFFLFPWYKISQDIFHRSRAQVIKVLIEAVIISWKAIIMPKWLVTSTFSNGVGICDIGKYVSVFHMEFLEVMKYVKQ